MFSCIHDNNATLAGADTYTQKCDSYHREPHPSQQLNAVLYPPHSPRPVQRSHVDGLRVVQSTTVDEVLQSGEVEGLILLAKAAGEIRGREGRRGGGWGREWRERDKEGTQ